MSDGVDLSGSCSCGAVRYKIAGPAGVILACHCTQCRKQTGHHYAATRAAASAVTITGEDNLTWFTSSDWAKRGFCKTCGSHLFWKANDSDEISIGAGSIDGPTGLQIDTHIYVADKGDYYDIADGRPQKPIR